MDSCKETQDENGEIKELEFSGMTARCFQHELDHLNGILFIDHLSRLKLERSNEENRNEKKNMQDLENNSYKLPENIKTNNRELPNEGTVSEPIKYHQTNFDLVTHDDANRTIQWS